MVLLPKGDANDVPQFIAAGLTGIARVSPKSSKTLCASSSISLLEQLFTL